MRIAIPVPSEPERRRRHRFFIDGVEWRKTAWVHRPFELAGRAPQELPAALDVQRGARSALLFRPRGEEPGA